MRVALVIAVTSALLGVGAVPTAWADGSDFDRNANWPQPTFHADVQSRSDGVYVHVTGREAMPASSPAPSEAPSSASGPSRAAAPQGSSPKSGSGSEVTSVRSWYDPVRGYFSESPDGHVTGLEGMNISNVATEPGGWYTVGRQQHPNSVAMALTVDGQYQDTVWIPDNAQNVQFGPPPDAPPDVKPSANGGSDPHDVALDMIAHIPLPDIHLKVNPDLGLVAIPEWFWIEGYDGRPFGQSRTVTLPPPAPGLPPTSFTVTVRVWPREYEWAFGDGQQFVTQSIGKAYPLESDIQHMYQHSSFAFSQGYPLWLTVKYGAEYQVNGGAWQPLPDIQHTYQATHQVQEIQSILDRPKQP